MLAWLVKMDLVEINRRIPLTHEFGHHCEEVTGSHLNVTKYETSVSQTR